MIQNIRTYSLILICGLLVVACKKYPEGGYIYKRDTDIQRQWYLTLYEVDGIDSTDLINYNNDVSYKNIRFLKRNSNDPDISVFTSGSYYSPSRFTNSNKNLNFYKSNPSSVICNSGFCFKAYCAPEGLSVQWEIIQLTSTDMILTCRLNHSYKLKFKS